MSRGRGAMTMRAQVSRMTKSGTDPFGQPAVSEFVPVGEVPCRAWSKTRREVLDDGKEAIVEDIRAMAPSSADVREGDRLLITDRLGRRKFDGPIAVRTITRRGGAKSADGHNELILTRHL